MSGDVQPRKRKDKKKKKDELSVDEPRGTAAVLGEGDVFMHSQHDHGTGGHWCAKIIFFSLLAVLITLIGLIILENRGLSELEANAVESRYSGVLEGWLEDVPDDDHHDAHTLELKHHAEDTDDHIDESNDHDDEIVHEDEGEHDDDDDLLEDDDIEDDEHGDDDDEEAGDDEHAEEQDVGTAEDEEEVEEYNYAKYFRRRHKDEAEDDEDNGNNEQSNEDEPDIDNFDDEDDHDGQNSLSNEIEEDEKTNENDDEDQSNEEYDDNNESNELQNREDEDHENEDEEEDSDIEVENIEKEESEEEEPISLELPTLPEADEDGDDDGDDAEDSKDQDGESNEIEPQEDDGYGDDNDNDDNSLEADDDDEPPIERIITPAGKPLVEVEEDESSEKPPDTLEEEAEYEKKQEELRKEEEQASHKDGGNSVEDDWPGEPSDAYWRQQLDDAEEDLRQGAWLRAAENAGAAELLESGRARYVIATALDRAAEANRDNRLLSRAIAAYLHLLKMNERLSDTKLLQITNRTLDRIQFRGNYLNAEPVYRLLIRRFPDDPAYRNSLMVSFLMANRADLAEEVLDETLRRWPNDRVALAHYGFILKTQHKRFIEAVDALQKALEGDKGPACEPRFYYHLGDALLLLGRYSDAHEVHKRGAKYGHFLSPAQRSLYNVPRLKGQPWWNIEDTPYVNLARALEKSWKDILKEGEAAQALYEKEKEGLKERGEWSQLDLFVRGREVPDRCKRAPVTCSVVKSEVAAVGCRRGQIKFSAMAAGTHVRPHVGPTNCRLRMHLGLSNTKDTYLRVDQDTRQWQEGKVLLFDDSFEHEVWHNGTGKRLVLIVDVWHPELTAAERRQLPAI